MENWQVAVVVLVAVLVGASIPALIQLSAALRAANSFFTTNSQRLDQALREATETVARIGHVATEVEGSIKRVEVFLDATGDLANSIKELSDKIRSAAAIGAAVGPVVAAAVRAFVAPDDASDEKPKAQTAPEQ